MKTAFTILGLLWIGCIMQSCLTAEYLFNKEKYEQLVKQHLKSGKKARLKTAEIGYFIDGFNAWQYQLKGELNHLLESVHYKDWMSGVERLNEIDEIQKEVEHFPQLDLSDLSWLKVADWKIRFKDQVYAYHVQKYERLLLEYKELEERNLVIQAYIEITKIEAFSLKPNPSDIAARRAHCLALGHRFIKIEILNEERWLSTRLLDYFEERIVSPGDEWNTVLALDSEAMADYEVRIVLEDLDKDESSSTSSTEHSKEVVDRYETKQDTSGKTIKTAIYKTISATVYKVDWTYEASGRISVQVRNNRSEIVSIKGDTFYASCADSCEEVSVSGNEDAISGSIFCKTCAAPSFDALETGVLRHLARSTNSFLEKLARH